MSLLRGGWRLHADATPFGGVVSLPEMRPHRDAGDTRVQVFLSEVRGIKPSGLIDRQGGLARSQVASREATLGKGANKATKAAAKAQTRAAQTTEGPLGRRSSVNEGSGNKEGPNPRKGCGVPGNGYGPV